MVPACGRELRQRLIPGDPFLRRRRRFCDDRIELGAIERGEGRAPERRPQGRGRFSCALVFEKKRKAQRRAILKRQRKAQRRAIQRAGRRVGVVHT
jgi:hypothetical protein